jgi:hypothetical protein
MTMSLVYGGITTQEIIVSFFVHIPNKDTLPSFKNNRDGMIIVCTKLFFKLKKMLCLIRISMNGTHSVILKAKKIKVNGSK